MHLDIGGGEFAQALPAGAAGRHRPLVSANDQNLGNSLMALRDHRGDGAGLGAGTDGIGRVLDIAAAEHATLDAA